MSLVHFYHIYADGQWRVPLEEQIEALRVSGWEGDLVFGIVGQQDRRDEVDQVLSHAYKGRYTTVEADEGYEQVTIHEIESYVKTHDGALMYGHTKGAGFPGEIQDAWRRSMIKKIVLEWRTCVALIDQGVEAVGCHWLVPEDWSIVHTPMFGGNFWVASCAYLRRLPVCADHYRHAAEEWVGLGDPRPVVHDLFPGWPGTRGF